MPPFCFTFKPEGLVSFSPEKAALAFIVAVGWSEVIIDGEKVAFTEETIETSSYVNFDSQIKATKELVCSFK